MSARALIDTGFAGFVRVRQRSSRGVSGFPESLFSSLSSFSSRALSFTLMKAGISQSCLQWAHKPRTSLFSDGGWLMEYWTE